MAYLGNRFIMYCSRRKREGNVIISPNFSWRVSRNLPINCVHHCSYGGASTGKSLSSCVFPANQHMGMYICKIDNAYKARFRCKKISHEYVVVSLTRHSKGIIQELNVNLSIHVDSKRSLQNHVLSRTAHLLYVVKYTPWVLIHHPIDE